MCVQTRHVLHSSGKIVGERERLADVGVSTEGQVLNAPAHRSQNVTAHVMCVCVCVLAYLRACVHDCCMSGLTLRMRNLSPTNNLSASSAHGSSMRSSFREPISKRKSPRHVWLSGQPRQRSLSRLQRKDASSSSGRIVSVCLSFCVFVRACLSVCLSLSLSLSLSPSPSLSLSVFSSCRILRRHRQRPTGEGDGPPRSSSSEPLCVCARACV